MPPQENHVGYLKFSWAGLRIHQVVEVRRHDPDERKKDRRYLSRLSYAADAAFNSRSREHEPLNASLAGIEPISLGRPMAWAAILATNASFG